MLKASLCISGFFFAGLAIVAVFGMIRGTLGLADGALYAVVFAAASYPALWLANRPTR